MRKIFTALLVLAGSMLSSQLAYAHPHLRSATPGPGSVLRAAPNELRLTFNEALLPRFSAVQVTDQSGRVVPTAARMAANKRQIVVGLPARLGPGVYRVTWRVVSADTHRLSGRYIFRVRA